MPACIKCQVLPGLFSDEYLLKLVDANGIVSSLFCPTELVHIKDQPSEGESVEGLLEIAEVKRAKGLVLVQLPRDTIENGPYITVKAAEVGICDTRQPA